MDREFENIRDYIGKKAEKSWVGTNCVYKRSKKIMGFGQTMDLKLKEIIQGKGRKIMGLERTVYLEEEEK